MNLRDLEYFVTVAELGHFSEAAEKCFVSQPTLSGQLRKLEEELGQSLFERNTRSVRLTPFGKEALPIAQSILNQTEALQRKAQEKQDPFVGAVTLGAFPTLSPWLLPRLSLALHESYPSADFFLIEDKSPNLQKQLQANEIDAAFLALPQEMDGIDVCNVFTEPFWLAIPGDHPWKRRKLIRTQELENQELLLLEDGHCLRDQALDLCHRYGAKEKGLFRSTGLETLRQMVRMGAGMTLIPRMAIPESQETGIHYIPLKGQDAWRDIALCFRNTHPRRALFEDIIDLIHSLCQSTLPVDPLV